MEFGTELFLDKGKLSSSHSISIGNVFGNVCSAFKLFFHLVLRLNFFDSEGSVPHFINATNPSKCHKARSILLHFGDLLIHYIDVQIVLDS